jgi:acyl dehydratase
VSDSAAPGNSATTQAIAVALAALRPRIGETFGPSRWLTVDQAMIDAFAALTDDRQFIHVDPEAARASPLGTTVAHGFFTLSLLSTLARGLVPPVPGRAMGLNYGFDRLRFVAPVPAGARIRARFRLDEARAKPPDAVLMRLATTIEIEAGARPAVAADWLVMSVLDVRDGGEG